MKKKRRKKKHYKKVKVKEISFLSVELELKISRDV